MQNQESLNPRFDKNIEALLKVNPLLAAQLKTLEVNQKYEVYIGKDPLNINIYDKKNKVSLYQKSPLEETTDKIKEFEPFKLHPFFYFFGCGNGVFYRILLNQNKNIKKLFIFEPELELIYIALSFADFSEEILSQKLLIFWTRTTNFGELDEFLVTDGQWIYSRIYNLHLLNSYYGRYSEECLKINGILTRSLEHHVIAVGNDSTDALIGLEHHLQNLPEMITTPSMLNLIENAKTTSTAVIVSTGPSLYKQLPLLKEHADKITIFSVDASFPILIKHGIKPDIVVTLERVELTADFYLKTPQEAQKGIIFAMTSIVHKATTDAITQGTKTFSMRPFGYTRFFNLIEYGYAGIGMSAANMAYEIIVHSKFERCVFIGQDLAFGKDGKTHSKDAIFGEQEEQYKPATNTLDKILVPAYGGKGVVETNRVWNMFLNFFEKDIAQTPYPIEAINSTEGGARIEGTKEIPFKEVLESLPKITKKQIKLTPPTTTEIKNSQKQIKTKIKEFLEYGYQTKKIVEDTFLRVVKMTEELERLNRENKLEKINFKEMDNISDKIDSIKDLFKEDIFIKVFSDAVQSYIVHQELEFAKIVVRPVHSLIEKQVKQIDWLYAHKFWLFSLAGGMDATLEVAKRAIASWYDAKELAEIEAKIATNLQETRETKEKK
ncbi:motility associated factor glycosyltransferase family protein [Helicobacter turcicus]|uniref:Motility associated factor glycosyltransferase family protein n=1 Tax=Helicobacter turcicus TaxID=2867412 RepID=A0ABS7JMR0_9HELI|nr:motility associated factor glycosyltransferase family protein [Helicobacter turcicus]MBX7490690.1 motility associated factor glycosyltransferase family protein [Helicobacter turcicus]MBX7545401.1 motility associated factor glycosyltransferase family protein [Helicobacter turcicus]